MTPLCFKEILNQEVVGFPLLKSAFLIGAQGIITLKFEGIGLFPLSKKSTYLEGDVNKPCMNI